MRCFTEEWYQVAQFMDFYENLEESEQAAVFSEAYFQELYASREADMLEMQKLLPGMAFEEMCGISEEMFSELEDAATQYQQAKEAFERMKKNRGPFDEVKEKENFAAFFQGQIRTLQENLPPEILNEVADIRVLALGAATATVIEEITMFCEACRDAVYEIEENYSKYWDKFLKTHPDSFVQDFSLQDSVILNLEQAEDQIVLHMDCALSTTKCSAIHLHHAKLGTCEELPERAQWLMDELYEENGIYELHILMAQHEDESALRELTIQAEQIQLV